ncbi:hypothetical protein ZHAS_00014694 [Anopheles sinensis]|uniref:Uncharacterized protein n=1 Tax=Anopheles sinensis TaxID=74873 RepID=A0A084W904_ANOSI|nr:hypothetical protein ZHAS_00014694 [Anopheles sinensis]
MATEESNLIHSNLRGSLSLTSICCVFGPKPSATSRPSSLVRLGQPATPYTRKTFANVGGEFEEQNTLGSEE